MTRRCTSTAASARRRTDGRSAPRAHRRARAPAARASPKLVGITVVGSRSSVELGRAGRGGATRIAWMARSRPDLDARDGGAAGTSQPDPCAAADVDDRSVGGIDAGEHVEQLQPERRPTCRWPAGRRTRPSPRRTDRARSTRPVPQRRRRPHRAGAAAVDTSGVDGRQQMHPAGILLPGLAFEPAHERVVAPGERGQHSADLVDRVEPVLALGAALQLARPSARHATSAPTAPPSRRRSSPSTSGTTWRYLIARFDVLCTVRVSPRLAQRGRAPARSPARRS